MAGPYSYEFINQYNAAQNPSTVHCKNNALTMFFKRYLYQRVFSVFKWEAPKNWNMDYFQFVLYRCGYIAILNTRQFGVIPQICGLRGYNVFYAPTHAVIVNPFFTGIVEPKIDKQCTVLKLTPDYCGIDDLISYYAELMALCSEAGGMNLINSKLAYVLTAKNKAMAEGLKKIYDMIQTGNPAVVADEEYSNKNALSGDVSPLELHSTKVKENFIAPDLWLTLRKIENDFLTKIGIPNTNVEKKERLISDEVEANREETYSIPAGWLERLQAGCEQARNMFGIHLSVDWRCPPNGDNVNTRAVSLE